MDNFCFVRVNLAAAEDIYNFCQVLAKIALRTKYLHVTFFSHADQHVAQSIIIVAQCTN